MNENYIEEMENEGEALNQSLALNKVIINLLKQQRETNIGDTLGYSEASIKAKHRKILKKLNKLL